MIYKKGDWLMFMKGGTPVIGVVLHVRTDRWPDMAEYITTEGVVTGRQVLEARNSYPNHKGVKEGKSDG